MYIICAYHGGNIVQVHPVSNLPVKHYLYIFTLCHTYVHVIILFQNHTAVSRALAILSDTFAVSFAVQAVQNAYLQFEALSQHSYSYTCGFCGFYPHTLILDGNKKCAFRLNGLYMYLYYPHQLC